MTEQRREQRHWERLAQSDPMWVILPEPGKRGAWNEADFFDSGVREISAALSLLRERLGLVPRSGRALDFGCGLGRLTQALAERFDHVDGVDISATMIENASQRNRHGARVAYHVNATDRLSMIPDGTMDLVYSRITLQHIPRQAMKRYIAEFARVLSPGGVAMFQVLTRARSWSVRLRHRVRDALPRMYRWARDLVTRRARWEMNSISEDEVRQVVQTTGGRVIAVLEDERNGVFDSRWIIVTKPTD